ncbi:MAG TPA: FAD-dependent oxidoreductase [Chloroflexota bacterium]
MADPPRYVVIGNGIAGTTAAETLRKNDPDCHISLYTDEPYPLYNRVALPPALKLEKPLVKTSMKTVEAHREKNICFEPRTPIVEINLDGRYVKTSTGAEVPYDKLLVATGGTPFHLDVPGADSKGVCYFQTYDDTAEILERIPRARSAVAVGGSYIAYELAEALCVRGVHVSWLIRGTHFLHRVLDPDGGAVADALARRQGVDVIYRDTAERVDASNGQVAAVLTTGGRRIEADIVACGVGLHLNYDLLPRDRVEIDTGIVTNEFLETTTPDVYAAGDVAQFYDPDLDVHYTMGTWASATTHGRVAALNMAGQHQEFKDLRTYTSTLFDSRMTVVGATPEIRPDLESASTTIPPERNGGEWAYRRLFFYEKRLVGLVLIGNMKSKLDLVKVMRAREPVWDERERLLKL